MSATSAPGTTRRKTAPLKLALALLLTTVAPGVLAQSETARKLFAEAFDSLKANRPAQAVERFERGLNIDPRNALALAYLGQAYLQLGQASNARSSWERVLKLVDNGDAFDVAARGLAKLPREGTTATVAPAPTSQLLGQWKLVSRDGSGGSFGYESMVVIEGDPLNTVKRTTDCMFRLSVGDQPRTCWATFFAGDLIVIPITVHQYDPPSKAILSYADEGDREWRLTARLNGDNLEGLVNDNTRYSRVKYSATFARAGSTAERRGTEARQERDSAARAQLQAAFGGSWSRTGADSTRYGRGGKCRSQDTLVSDTLNIRATSPSEILVEREFTFSEMASGKDCIIRNDLIYVSVTVREQAVLKASAQGGGVWLAEGEKKILRCTGDCKDGDEDEYKIGATDSYRLTLRNGTVEVEGSKWPIYTRSR